MNGGPARPAWRVDVVEHLGGRTYDRRACACGGGRSCAGAVRPERRGSRSRRGSTCRWPSDGLHLPSTTAGRQRARVTYDPALPGSYGGGGPRRSGFPLPALPGSRGRPKLEAAGAVRASREVPRRERSCPGGGPGRCWTTGCLAAALWHESRRCWRRLRARLARREVAAVRRVDGRPTWRLAGGGPLHLPRGNVRRASATPITDDAQCRWAGDPAGRCVGLVRPGEGPRSSTAGISRVTRLIDALAPALWGRGAAPVAGRRDGSAPMTARRHGPPPGRGSSRRGDFAWARRRTRSTAGSIRAVVWVAPPPVDEAALARAGGASGRSPW